MKLSACHPVVFSISVGKILFWMEFMPFKAPSSFRSMVKSDKCIRHPYGLNKGARVLQVLLAVLLSRQTLVNFDSILAAVEFTTPQLTVSLWVLAIFKNIFPVFKNFYSYKEDRFHKFHPKK